VQSGGLFHGIQLWVNLPRAQKWSDPRYQDLRGGDVALTTSADAGALVRVIAGDVGGHSGPGSTYTPMTMVHATVAPTAQLELPWRPDYNALVYALAGRGSVGTERRPLRAGQLAVLGKGDVVRVAGAADTNSSALEVLVLGGRPIGEPVAWAGPFVMNTRREVIDAFEDFQRGRMGRIPALHGAPTRVVESPGA
jgi:hypothetical protein